MELAKKFSTTKPSGMVRVFQAIEKMTDVLNLSIGEPDFPTEPDIIEAGAKGALATILRFRIFLTFLQT